MAGSKEITKSSSAEYFSKNLQQVGFSSYTKAALTAIKEAIDNSLDACEEAGILPELTVTVEKIGNGSTKNADLVRIRIDDNGPGIGPDDVVKVFGEYLASSKFGRGRCSRGQQGIGISAVTTWAQLTHGKGALVITKKKNMRQAIKCRVAVDIKNNRGLLQQREMIEWERPHGVSCEFVMDARVQLNGEGGLLTYLQSTALVNPHLTLHYKLLDNKTVTVTRITDDVPVVPEATEPHPHTMKLGEFIAHGHLYGRIKTSKWLKEGFSRISDSILTAIVRESGLAKKVLDKVVSHLSETEYREIYKALQDAKLMAPSTKSVLAIGEPLLATSINRLGEVDFFSVVSRKPAICDFKPVLVEVAIARLKDKISDGEKESPVQILRFANRVPLQFDKSSCAIVKAIESINWKPYGLNQSKNSLPIGPYIIAVSIVSPFIKFKNASKETVDASDELINEFRLALIQCGQRLGAHIRREAKMADMERKLQHIEQFAPILVKGLCRITGACEKREKKAMEGLSKILGRDAKSAEQELNAAHDKAEAVLEDRKKRLGDVEEKLDDLDAIQPLVKRGQGGRDQEQLDLDL